MRACKGLELAEIVTGTVPGFIKRKIDHQLPAFIAVLQGGVRQLADTPEEHNAGPLGVFPQKVVVLLERVFALDPKLLEEHLAHTADAIPDIILAACLFNDHLGIDS